MHDAIHGKGPLKFSKAAKLWYGTPEWTKKYSGSSYPFGRKGNPETQKKVREVEELIKTRHPEWKHEAGGSLREKNITVPGGSKPSRSPDLIFRKPNGEKRLVNVGRITKGSKPVKRERDALDDLRKIKGTRTQFIPLRK